MNNNKLYNNIINDVQKIIYTHLNENKLNKIEDKLTNKFIDLRNQKIKLDIDSDFLQKRLADKTARRSIYSAIGILVENKIYNFIENNIDFKYFEERYKTYLKNKDTYNYYDFKYESLKFEIKTFFTNIENLHIYISNSQKQNIGQKGLFLLAKVHLNNNEVIIDDIFIKQRKNLKIHNNYIIGFL